MTSLALLGLLFAPPVPAGGAGPALEVMGIDAAAWASMDARTREGLERLGVRLSRGGDDPRAKAEAFLSFAEGAAGGPPAAYGRFFAAEALGEADPAAAARLYLRFADGSDDPGAADEARLRAAGLLRAAAGELDASLAAVRAVGRPGEGGARTFDEAQQAAAVSLGRVRAGDADGALLAFDAAAPGPDVPAEVWRKYHGDATLLASQLSDPRRKLTLYRNLLAAAGDRADAGLLAEVAALSRSAGDAETGRTLDEAVVKFFPRDRQAVKALKRLREDATARGDAAAAGALDERVLRHPRATPDDRFEAANRLGDVTRAVRPPAPAPRPDPAFPPR